MIFIMVAIYQEAQPLISYLGLKRDPHATRFQVFRNEDATLIISGRDILSAAIASAYLLTQYQVQKSDLFVNFGICRAKRKDIPIGSAVLCHKIIHHDTKKAYYPDILFKHPFMEGVLETFSNDMERERYLEVTGDLIDMEGAGAFKAAHTFLPPHHIYCIKIVSDYMEKENTRPEKVMEGIERYVPLVWRWIKEVEEITGLSLDILTEEEKNELRLIVKNLKLTVTMDYQLQQLAQQYKVRTGELLKLIRFFSGIECKSKNEGKMYFAKLKERLMEC